MKAPKHSLRKIVSFLNNPDEEGGFWLPNIQRPFVWSEDQLCRLFDSILREYPISTLLVWKTKLPVRCRKFIDNYRPGMKLSHLYIPETNSKKCLVLDGQQRLQTLFIGLCGSYEDRELYFDILSGEVAAPDDVKYRFAFRDPKTTTFPWVKFKELVFSRDDPLSAAEGIIAQVGESLAHEDRRKISRHVGIVFRAFHSDDGISYQELDSVENESLYSEDDVVEVFIRANSGGTRLGKSDLLFSLLTASMEDSYARMEDLLDELNRPGFEFTRDFVLKTCLSLLDQGARYEVQKFRDLKVRERIESDWDGIATAIKDVADFIRGKTYVRCDKALPSYLVLIPLIYMRYHAPRAWDEARNIDMYLLRSLLAGAYGGTPDQLIDDSVGLLREVSAFDLEQMFDVIRTQGRSLELTEARFWEMGYGSKNIHLLFNIWYREFNYTPAFQNNLPQVDHIFPQSLLRVIKVPNPTTGRPVMKYPQWARDQLANCMLLTQEENGAGGKWDTPPDQWFDGKSDAYLEQHLIPKDRALWQLDRFEDFIAERKKLIASRFSFLITSSAAAVAS